VIDWVETACRSWGSCTRWILTDTGEGYPSADTIEKARQGMLSAKAQAVRSAHFPEVRLNGALAIARAMKIEPHMPLPLTATMWAHYVVQGRARAKLPALSRFLGEPVTTAGYWRNLDRAHWFLAGRMVELPCEGVQLDSQ
jgi:hypothetical protein